MDSRSSIRQPRLHRLGDLQVKVMQALWKRAEATVADVHEALAAEHDLAYTTVATLLRRLEHRGLVTHRVEGRTFIYRAFVPAEAVTGGTTDHVLDRLFEGSLADLVSHVLSRREVTADELSKLERLIAEKKKSL